ncbi:hypothetical protein Afil01_43260 [Actinorhabdospora filicis]|uniref:Peptidase M23 n=1 Tax=Actinorhabdospora filicis TaxID=1785913 RepID=A0A9W6WAC4_9ACTN|nr:hypothetical protein [Actinorhabdospora filicis]GLZ79519.1 hypothetical protein Afil01_43260 [Actinorhabdospora filicis]
MPAAKDSETGHHRIRLDDQTAPGRHRLRSGRHRAERGADWLTVPAGAIALLVEQALHHRRRVAHFALTGVIAATASGVVVQAPALAAEPRMAAIAVMDAASRSTEREPATAPPALPPKEPVSEIDIKKLSAELTPVAGLDSEQTNNAAKIIEAGKEMDVPKEALVIAIMTAMQESRLYNLASYVVPESLDYDHQGTGADHDSIGLFQQRAQGGWGDVGTIMDPKSSAKSFFAALQRISGWEDMALTSAAQAVQVSAFPDAYAQHEDKARDIVDAIA